MRLAHIHLPGLTRYAHASTLQERLVRSFLNYKANPSSTFTPNPTVITTEFHPVYTCGRREVGNVSHEQQAYLKADGRADFAEALRGGQTTFHGPGQLAAYPILDLKQHGLTPRRYVALLEKTLIETCADYGIKAMTTKNTGVWVDEEHKIAAIGVHLRRSVSSHGVGLNVGTDMWWFNRIVACGLEGKKTTSFEGQGVKGKSVAQVGDVFVRRLAEGLQNVDGIDRTIQDAC